MTNLETLLEQTRFNPSRNLWSYIAEALGTLIQEIASSLPKKYKMSPSGRVRTSLTSAVLTLKGTYEGEDASLTIMSDLDPTSGRVVVTPALRFSDGSRMYSLKSEWPPKTPFKKIVSRVSSNLEAESMNKLM